MGENERESTAQGHVIPCWAGCQWKKGLFHMVLVSWWPAPEIQATLSCPSIIQNRQAWEVMKKTVDWISMRWWGLKTSPNLCLSWHTQRNVSMHVWSPPCRWYMWVDEKRKWYFQKEAVCQVCPSSSDIQFMVTGVLESIPAAVD